MSGADGDGILQGESFSFFIHDVHLFCCQVFEKIDLTLLNRLLRLILDHNIADYMV